VSPGIQDFLLIEKPPQQHALVLASGKPFKLNITPEVLRWAAIPAVPAARFAPRNAHLFF